MNKYLETGELSDEEIKRALRERTIAQRDRADAVRHRLQEQGRAGDAGRGHRLPAVARWTSRRSRASSRTARKASASAADDEPFAGARVQDHDRPLRRPADLLPRLFGRGQSGDTIYNPIKGKKERIGRILQMHANQREEIKEVRAGDIAAAVGLREATTGDTLCDPGQDHHPRAHDLPGAGDLAGRRAEDQGRPGKDGHRAEPPRAGGPDFPRAHRRGDGPDHHLRHGRAAPRDHRRPHEARVRRRGERRQAAGGLPRDDPQDRSTRSKASSSSSRAAAASTATWCSRSSRRRRARASSSSTRSRAARCRASTSRRSRRASTRRCRAGVLAGYPVVDVRVTLFYGSYHEVDSNENAFKMAALDGASRKACAARVRSLLEPIMAVEVETPEDYMGNVIGDLIVAPRQDPGHGGHGRRRQGHQAPRCRWPRCSATRPTLRSLTQGRATYTMEFKHYAEAPKNVAEAIINQKAAAD